ncbi:MAG: nuclear transport factor 2 family protein, partial [Hydrococcus sp. RU_2_2]|nr:nuclear transport factor 2 family protein [Hydrococcus sp. RU_2_2]
MTRLTILFIIIGNQLFGQTTTASDEKILFGQIINADSAFFQSLNNCDLKTYESFLTDDFEFYHDKGGLTKSRESEMKSMTSFCGEQRQRQKLRRELIRESVEINPIKNFGAVETGRHRFFLVIDDKTEKLIEEAKFTNIWLNQTTGWKLSRVISYDH